MLKISDQINSFNFDVAKSGSFFTGSMNTETLPFDPLITGYAVIKWISFPKWVEQACPGFKELTEKNLKSFDGISDMELQSAEYQHTFNGNAYNYATTINKNNTEFTLKHQEFSGNPIKNGYQLWLSGIRDPRTDVATYPKIYHTDYAAKNHTGKLLYIMTRPDVDNIEQRNIEFAAYFTGVFPTKIPLGHLNFSLDSHDSPEIDISFKGTMHIGPKVDEFAKAELAKSYAFVYEGDFVPKTGPDGANQLSAYSHSMDGSPLPKAEIKTFGS